MLAIGFKTSETPAAKFQSTLRAFLDREYAAVRIDPAASAEAAAEAAAPAPSLSDEQQHALAQFAQLKQDVDLVRSPSPISRHVLIRYAAQLARMRLRWPDDDAALRLQFTWTDSFCPRKRNTQVGLQFEQAAVLFNIGALESQLGVQTDRSSAEGLKAACRHFTLAAGAFSQCQTQFVGQCLGPQTPDLSTEGLGMLTALMLAQAQACCYEKAIKDQMKDAIKAKLAHQAVEFYQNALELCRAPALNGVIDRLWSVHVQFQVHSMRAAMQYWQARAAKELALTRGVGYGEEIVRLQLALSACQDAVKVATQNRLPTSLRESIRMLENAAQEQLRVAEKDNASVYLDNVPKARDLPEVGKAALVKPLALTDEEMAHEMNGVDLFELFVPKVLLARAAEVKDQVGELLATTKERRTKTTEHIRERLHEMGLPAAIEAFEKTNDHGMPPSLWQKIERVQKTATTNATATGALQFVETRIKENAAASDRAEKALRSIEGKLAEEEIEDNVCRQNYGERWRRPMSSTLNQSFRLDIDRYYRLLREAKQSDAVVVQKVSASRALLELLTQTKASLDARLPQLKDGTSSCLAEITTISTLLQRLSDLMEEKDQVVRDFEASLAKFDVVPLLTQSAKSAGDAEAALAHEQAFFTDQFVTKLETIITDEESALGELALANDGFEAKRATDAMVVARQGFLQQLGDAVDAFEQLESNLKEGAHFYAEMATRLTQLQQTVDDHSAARDIERREMELHAKAEADQRAREEEDAALAQQMMGGMGMRAQTDAATTAGDEALARELAADTPQHYPSVSPSSPPVAPNGSAYPVPPQAAHPFALYQQMYGMPSAPPPAYGAYGAAAYPPPPFASYYAPPGAQATAPTFAYPAYQPPPAGYPSASTSTSTPPPQNPPPSSV